MYYNQAQYPEAITHYGKAVTLFEKIRKTATGDARRDYLAQFIAAYQYLTSCYVRTDDFSKAFEAIELSRAKLLAERLAGSDEVNIPSLGDLQNALPKDTAVLVYANTNRKNMVQVIITKKHVTALERSINDFVQEVKNGSESETAEGAVTSKRGLTVGTEEQQEPVTTEGKKTMTFATIIQDYRRRLQNPTIKWQRVKKGSGRRQDGTNTRIVEQVVI